MLKSGWDQLHDFGLLSLKLWITHWLTRVKSRDASASKNSNHFSQGGKMQHIHQGITKPFTFSFIAHGSLLQSKHIFSSSRNWHFPYNPSYQDENVFREKLEVISSNRRGQPSYSYFSFFVCRNPVQLLKEIVGKHFISSSRCQSWVQSISTTWNGRPR